MFSSVLAIKLNSAIFTSTPSGKLHCHRYCIVLRGWFNKSSTSTRHLTLTKFDQDASFILCSRNFESRQWHEFRRKWKKWIATAKQALYFAEKKITRSKGKFDKYFGDFAPLISILKKWLTEFHCCSTSTNDTKHSEHLIEGATFDTIMILTDRRL